MLNTPELAQAIARALDLLRLQGITQRQVADAFGVKAASVSDWKKTGRIGKQRLFELIAYCNAHLSPALPASHWGLSDDSVEWQHAAHQAAHDALIEAGGFSGNPQVLLQLAESLRDMAPSDQARLVDIARVLATDYSRPAKRATNKKKARSNGKNLTVSRRRATPRR